MQLIEWEVAEDGYEEQINIPKDKRDIAEGEGISTEVGKKIAVTILILIIQGISHNRICIATENMFQYSPTYSIRTQNGGNGWYQG